MLTIEYLEKHGLFLVIPVNRYFRKEDEHTEFLFSNVEELRQFTKAYFKNPISAIFAYDVLEKNRM